jgi:hypothetical protein
MELYSFLAIFEEVDTNTFLLGKNYKINESLLKKLKRCSIYN